MQYPCTLNRQQLIELATKTYFGNVDQKNMDAVLACFNDEALFTVQTAHTTHAGKAEIKEMFTRFFESYDSIVHKDFECTVDDTNGRICASFVAELVTPDGGTEILRNTNFWRIRGDKFQEVFVYMSGENVLV